MNYTMSDSKHIQDSLTEPLVSKTKKLVVPLIDDSVIPYIEDMFPSKVLVLCATGKVGNNVCYALQRRGFDVYGTTRSSKGAGALSAKGVKPVIADYTKAYDLDKAFILTGCRWAFIITDYFRAARSSWRKELQQGKAMVDACKRAGCTFVVYSSAADADKFSPKVRHLVAKPKVEDYLLASGLNAAVIRPAAFFENLDDSANWNPLKPGRVKFLTDCEVNFVSTYDVGQLAAQMFLYPAEWNGRIVEAASWKGTVYEIAQILEKLSGQRTVGSMTMPRFFRWLFLNDLHHMCRYFEEGYLDSQVDIAAFRKLVPDALDAEGWLRFHQVYANGTSIVKPN